MADALAKEATSLSDSSTQRFFPLAAIVSEESNKIKTTKILARGLDKFPTARYAYQLLPKVSEKTLLHHRNLYIFARNYGPFPSYLYGINKSLSELCVCGKRGTSLHYILNCEVTSTYHRRKLSTTSYSDWFNYILKKPSLLQKINCTKKLENNQYISQNIDPYSEDLQ